MFSMNRQSLEAIGLRLTGWAALNRDPQNDLLEFRCPKCGAEGMKAARHERSVYKFTDGFLQDLEGEATSCRGCKQALRIVPVVMVHDKDEKRRFEAVFADALAPMST